MPHTATVFRGPHSVGSKGIEKLTTSRRIEIEGRAIEYSIKRSQRRKKTIGVRVAPGLVEVAAPSRTRIADIEEILRKRGKWILEKLADASALPPPPMMTSGEIFPFLGTELSLLVREADVRRPSARREGNTLEVRVAPGLDEDTRREHVRAVIAAWYRVQLRPFLEESVARWLPVMGRTEAPRVLVREQRTRWGSCSSDGTLRFSWRLAMVAPDLVDSVVVHELAHLDVMNHSPAFWEVVLRAMPDARERRNRLNEEGRSLPL